MTKLSSAQKQAITSGTRAVRNRAVRSALKTAIGGAEKSIGKVDTSAMEYVKTAISKLDSAVSKGILHRNNAARRKSRLMKKLNQLKTEKEVSQDTKKT